MPPEVETLEGTAISETTPSTPEGETEGVATEELDYKALYEGEKATREKIERDQRARDIQLLSQKRQQELVTQTHAMTQAIFARLAKGEIDEREAQVAITQGVSQLQQDVASPPQETMRQTLLSTETEIKQALVTLGLGKDDAGTVEIADERANHLNDLWDEAVKAYREKKYEASEAWRDSAMRELKRLQAQVTAEKGRGRSGLGLNERNGRGAAAGMSLQEKVNRFAKGERMSTADMLAAGKAMDDGMYPTK